MGGPRRKKKAGNAGLSRMRPAIKKTLDGVTIKVGQRSLKMSRKEYADLQLLMGAMP